MISDKWQWEPFQNHIPVPNADESDCPDMSADKRWWREAVERAFNEARQEVIEDMKRAPWENKREIE
jgi:hypothetical protein